jgi:hypothetical protein
MPAPRNTLNIRMQQPKIDTDTNHPEPAVRQTTKLFAVEDDSDNQHNGDDHGHTTKF